MSYLMLRARIRCGYNILTGEIKEAILDPPLPRPSEALAQWNKSKGKNP